MKEISVIHTCFEGAAVEVEDPVSLEFGIAYCLGSEHSTIKVISAGLKKNRSCIDGTAGLVDHPCSRPVRDVGRSIP
ncbi:MAG: hypothetical protein EB079_06015 [Verrucomicrobia bacterium]|nr:hypothetical protein [Verrucomicrobiota bacterium]